jgi:hypothetical protein
MLKKQWQKTINVSKQTNRLIHVLKAVTKKSVKGSTKSGDTDISNVPKQTDLSKAVTMYQIQRIYQKHWQCTETNGSTKSSDNVPKQTDLSKAVTMYQD